MLYSKPCKRQIREKIALHYPEGECETVWEQVQRQYVTFLRDWRTGRSSRRRRPATSWVSVGRGLNVVSASVLCRDDTTFKAPCKILQTCGTCYNNCPVCGTRLGYTPSCQPIPVHFVAANRDTSSKPPRFIRHWRRRNRDDPTFRAPCKALPNAWYAPQRPLRRRRAEGFLNHRFKRRPLGTLFRRRKKVPRRRHA